MQSKKGESVTLKGRAGTILSRRTPHGSTLIYEAALYLHNPLLKLRQFCFQKLWLTSRLLTK